MDTANQGILPFLGKAHNDENHDDALDKITGLSAALLLDEGPDSNASLSQALSFQDDIAGSHEGSAAEVAEEGSPASEEQAPTSMTSTHPSDDNENVEIVTMTPRPATSTALEATKADYVAGGFENVGEVQHLQWRRRHLDDIRAASVDVTRAACDLEEVLRMTKGPASIQSIRANDNVVILPPNALKIPLPQDSTAAEAAPPGKRQKPPTVAGDLTYCPFDKHALEGESYEHSFQVLILADAMAEKSTCTSATSISSATRSTGADVSLVRAKPTAAEEAQAIDTALQDAKAEEDDATAKFLSGLTDRSLATTQGVKSDISSLEGFDSADLTTKIAAENSKWQTPGRQYSDRGRDNFWLDEINLRVRASDSILRSEEDVGRFFASAARNRSLDELSLGGISLVEEVRGRDRPAAYGFHAGARKAGFRPANAGTLLCIVGMLLAARILATSTGLIYAASSSFPVFSWATLREVLIDNVTGAMIRFGTSVKWATVTSCRRRIDSIHGRGTRRFGCRRAFPFPRLLDEPTMAKSKNHTAHNQSKKAHRNGIKKPKTNKYASSRGVDAKVKRNQRFAMRGTQKAVKAAKEAKAAAAKA